VIAQTRDEHAIGRRPVHSLDLSLQDLDLPPQHQNLGLKRPPVRPSNGEGFQDAA
jgi:hypothetical protein